jgi:hypothetical protein
MTRWKVTRHYSALCLHLRPCLHSISLRLHLLILISAIVVLPHPNPFLPPPNSPPFPHPHPFPYPHLFPHPSLLALPLLHLLLLLVTECTEESIELDRKFTRGAVDPFHCYRWGGVDRRYAMLCCAVLCYTRLCYTMLCCAVLYYILLSFAVSYCAILQPCYHSPSCS